MRNPRSRPRVVWTTDMDASLRNMRAAGESYDACAVVFRVSRSWVVERCKALGIWEPAPGGAMVYELRRSAGIDAQERGLAASLAAAAERRREREYARQRAKMGLRQAGEPAPKRPTAAPVLLPMRPIPPPKTCQWPLTDGRPWLFCDATPGRQGASYCAEHHRAAHVKRAAQAAEDQGGEA